MKDILAILLSCKSKGIIITPDDSGNNLRIRGNVQQLSEQETAFLRTHKEEILSLLKNTRSTAYRHITRLPEQVHYELSSAQKGLWMASQLEGGGGAYNIPMSVIFEGTLNLEELAAAFNRLIERHEILRTVFREDEQGAIRQYVCTPESLDFNIHHVDLRGNTASVEDRVRQFSAQAFDLASGPLLRASLLQISDDQWVFTYVMHHIISDGWSMSILINELTTSYFSASPLSALNIQYRDYASWQQEQLKGPVMQSHEAYWKEQFSTPIPVLAFPGDKARPQIRGYEGGVVKRVIPAEQGKRLKQLCQENGSTLFMGLLALVDALLYRYTFQEDIIIGTQIAGREHAELEDQIGLYLNTLPLRVRFKGAHSFRELLLHVKEITLEAYAHQAYPFDTLIQELQLQRDMSRNPLFDVSVVLQNADVNSATNRKGAGALQIKPYLGDTLLISKYDFSFDFTEEGDEIKTSLDYNKGIYTGRTAEQLADHLLQLLAVILDQPEQSIQELQFLSAIEQTLLIHGLNDTAAAYPEEKSIAALFEMQVARTPDKIAVVARGQKLTYAELDKRAGLLAAYLRTHYEVVPGQLIGIMLDRSDWLIIAILGVLKAGAAYVPVDTDYPDTRKKFILQDTAVKVLITETDYMFDLPDFTGDVFAIDVQLDTIEEPLLPSVAGDLAYVMYTSGSTGTPKGVMTDQRGVVRLVMNTNYVQLTGKEVLLCTGAIAFDATTFEYWSMLLHGGTLVMCSKEVLLDTDRLSAVIRQEKVDTMWFTTGWFNQLVERNIRVFEGLRTVLFGGDRNSPSHVNACLRQYPSLQIIHCYGPTENTTYSLTYPVVAGLSDIPIGKPISNSTVYILDHLLQLCCTGVVGEICVGGDGLAKGYLNNPELTSEKFVPHPFQSGAFLYRSGDLGRWLPDGNIEFIGRKDEQVKIRGYRVEPGEVESVIREHPEVAVAVVMAKGNASGEKFLVAYVVGKKVLHAGDLRSWLKNKLPVYMVPDQYIQLESMPLRSNGKVDTSALLQLEGQDMDTGVAFEAPQSETEKKLAIIWEDILEKKNIGLKDNFFELGGHSLKATLLCSQIFKVFEIKIELKDVFGKPVLEEQAALISKAAHAAYSDIEKAPELEYYPLSSAQKRLFFMQEFAPESTSYNIPIVNYLGRHVDRERIAVILKMLVSRHESFRTSFEMIDGVAFQKIHADVPFELDEHTCSQDSFAAFARDYIRPFDLAAAPLFRSALVHITDAGYVWIIDVHHIIADGTSFQVLIDEFMLLYHEKALPALKLQYRDFSTWQNSLLESGDLDQQKQYWLSRFSDGIPVLDFPADRQRPAAFTFKGEHIIFSIDAATTARMRELGKKDNATLQMTLLAVLNVLFYKYTNQESMVIGCGIAGRRHPDLERIVGMFVNSLAVKSQLRGDMSFDTFHKTIIADCIAAYGNQDIQFEDLVDMLQVNRDASRNPLFDVSLVVQNFSKSKSDRSALIDDSDTPLQWEGSGTAKLDMDWLVEERDEDLLITLEYYAEIYDHSRIERVVKHFRNLLDIVLDNPHISLSAIRLPDEAENQLLFDQYVSGAHQDVPATTVHALFAKQCQLTPDSIAVSDSTGSLTYKELDQVSNQLARYLKQELGLREGAGVGMLNTGSRDVLVSMLGILKAGGVYIPLDPEHPEKRVLYMLHDAAANILLAGKDLIEMANRLLWQCAALQHIVCIDSLNVYAERGALRSELMRKDLWDQIGGLAVDAIAQGGWIDSYTGEDFSETEMREYSENAFLKLKDFLHKDMRVLEIGCSSGLTMFRIAPEVGYYYGTDLSSTILEKTREAAVAGQHHNITLACMPAHEIDLITEGDFDLVIINSVIQCFDGHNYLRDVLVKAIGKMKDKGLLFLGDLMDEDKREEMIASLTAFKNAHPETGRFTKTDWGVELFVSRDYLRDMINDQIGIAAVTCSDKIHTVSNELTRYRFDALLSIDRQALAVPVKRKKYLHDGHHIAAQDNSVFDVVENNNALAYVIYTSGSTGEPKGVMVEHGPLLMRLLAEQTLLHANEQLVTAMTTNFCFDVSLLETLFPLLTGGRTVALSRTVLQSPEAVIAALIKEKVTVLQGTPGFIKGIFLDTPVDLTGHSLSHMAIGGESMNGKLVSELRNKLPGVVINNHYGPTESVIDAIVLEDVQVFTQNIIGRPIANTRVYILGEAPGLLPVGATGEICIGGPGLARGYLNRPELTNERFVPDPFIPGQRIYRTGDLGRWLPDGNIQFAGRKDEQVKIRGYRIELGEIEKSLQQHTAINDAVVITRPTGNGDKELVAYIVSQEALDATNLRAYLGQTLPAYMLPTHFITLDQLPVTSNGKVDRKRLSDPGSNGITTGVEYVFPRNETEMKLVLIWQEVLGKDRVGVKDNFFSLGGHSLKATRLASQIHKQFDVKLALKDLFTHTELEQQAQLIRQTSRTAFATIPVIPVQDSYVLSSSQRRLWVLSQFEAGNIAYNMPAVYVFEGQLQQDKLAAAFTKLIKRHESLRTVFREVESGEVRQFVLPVASNGFHIINEDIRGMEDQQLQLQERVKHTSLAPFNLSEGPLLRAGLFQVANQQWVFCFAMHHIISDGWSIEVLIRELLTLYNSPDDALLPPLRIHYKDYAAWQQNLLHAPAFKQHANYWMEQFSGDLPVLQLTTDKVRPAVKTYNGGNIKKRFPIKELKAFCQQEGATLFMGLMTTVNALLYRYTGQEDIIIGSPIAGREHADLSDQIGFYVNTLALRTRFSRSAGFKTLLEQIREICLRAYEHQEYPFDELVDALQLHRDLSRHPLFDVMLVLQNVENGKQGTSQQLNALQVTEYKNDGDTFSKFELLFEFTEDGDEVILSLSYNSDLFYAATVERLADHLLAMLSAGLAAPDEPLSTLSYLSTAEQQQLLTTFNDTQVPYPSHSTIHELFEAQVKATPDRAALHFEEQTLSYQQLNERANQVAHYLHEQYHLQPDELVGLQVERSEWLLIAILGILKAGAAYVPLDMDYPKERLAHMLADSNCKLLLDESWLQSYKAEISAQPQTDLPGRASADSLAYVMYTSGSTGVPKGVMVCHRSVVRLVRPGSFATLDGSEILLSTGAVSFDATTFEYWGMLLNGGSLVLSSREVLLDTQQLGKLIRTKAVNMMWFTAGWLNQLVEEDIYLFGGLKTILAGGDKLSADHIRLLQQLYPDVRIINGYGPTENTTFSLTYEIPANGDILIGRPINNSTAYILDSARQLVPVGVEGEICVGGDGLGRGYLNNAVLTAEKFIPHPFRSGERLYRTGDLGRLLPDGNIVFAGRLDAQVKIRGYRIEPGEIEHLLQQHEGIDGAIVLARSTGGQDKELVAYLTGALIPEVSVLRDYLKQYLPDYMLPAYYVPLASFPLTANGKVDRRLLPDTGNAVATTVYIAPRNETEEKLVAIWEEILGRSPIGIQDNFFELGGHSLKVTKMAGQVRKQFDVSISLRTVFIHPTIEGIAGEIEKTYWANNELLELDDVEKITI